MPKLIIIRGNSGSGKSTVSSALQRKIGFGTFLISQDTVRREMLWVKDEPNNKAIDLLINLIEYGYQHCDTIILEGILTAQKYRKLFDRITALFSNNILAYYFDIPFEETLKRHAQRPKRHEFGEAEMRRWWEEKDMLENIHEKIIDEKMELDEIVELIYNDIKVLCR